jgi:hypothetical protein
VGAFAGEADVGLDAPAAFVDGAAARVLRGAALGS